MTNAFGLICPSCKGSDEIDITATVSVRLTADGTDADGSSNGGHEWDASSPAECGCGWSGTAGDLKDSDEEESGFSSEGRTTTGAQVGANSEPVSAPDAVLAEAAAEFFTAHADLLHGLTAYARQTGRAAYGDDLHQIDAMVGARLRKGGN